MDMDFVFLRPGKKSAQCKSRACGQGGEADEEHSKRGEKPQNL